MYFISFLGIEMVMVVKNHPKERQVLGRVNIVAADDLATQGARASAGMVLT